MKTFLLPYKISSMSCAALAKTLNLKRINLKKTKYEGKAHHLIINWGSGIDYPTKMLNRGCYVSLAANKLSSLQILKEAGVRTPDFTTSRGEALKWLDNGEAVVSRTLLNACGGKGVVVSQLVGNGGINDDQTIAKFPHCQLYVKYKKKAKEFRVHVFCGNVLDVQEKRKKKDWEGTVDNLIRNVDHGWVFCRDNVEEPEELRSIALAAVKALKLDFGACDIIWNKHENKCYVLEVNTAPGIEGTTVELYTNAIKAYIQKLENAQKYATVNYQL